MDFEVLYIGEIMVKIKNATGDWWYKLSDFEKKSSFSNDGFCIIEELPPTPKEIVEKEPFVWTDELVSDLVGVFCGMEDEDAKKEVEEYKKYKTIISPKLNKITDILNEQNKSQSIKAGSGTANDVFPQTPIKPILSEKYTEEDLKKAFEAGREALGGYNRSNHFSKYKTFQEYKNSLK